MVEEAPHAKETNLGRSGDKQATYAVQIPDSTDTQFAQACVSE